MAMQHLARSAGKYFASRPGTSCFAASSRGGTVMVPTCARSFCSGATLTPPSKKGPFTRLNKFLDYITYGPVMALALTIYGYYDIKQSSHSGSSSGGYGGGSSRNGVRRP